MSSYMALNGPKGLPVSTRVRNSLKLAIPIFLVLPISLLLFFGLPMYHAPQGSSFSQSTGLSSLHSSSSWSSSSSSPSKPPPPIPDIVHYVYIRASNESHIDFHFAHFLAVYSSILYIQPSKIYIHTDYTPDEIAAATSSGSKWTRHLLSSFTNLITWNPVQVPSHAGPNNTIRISAMQHKSDFLRWEQAEKIGGIYMDFDVLVLRPLTAFLNAGFAAVIGRQFEEGKPKAFINNGAFMTRPHGSLARVLARDQTALYTGSWNDNLMLTTHVAERLAGIPGEVLLMDRFTFAPTHWWTDEEEKVFLMHEGERSPAPEEGEREISKMDPVEAYDEMERVGKGRKKVEWERAFDESYLLHAFGLSGFQKWVTAKKVLERRSNYGVAAWGIVRKMVEDGLVDAEDDDWE